MKLIEKIMKKAQEYDDIKNGGLKMEKKKRKIVESEYNDLLEEYDNLKDKYIEILEEKSEKFDRFLEYYDQCKEYEVQIKEYKKEISELKAENKDNSEKIEQLGLNLEEKEKELASLRKKYKIKEPKSDLEKEIDKIVYGKENTNE